MATQRKGKFFYIRERYQRPRIQKGSHYGCYSVSAGILPSISTLLTSFSAVLTEFLQRLEAGCGDFAATVLA